MPRVMLQNRLVIAALMLEGRIQQSVPWPDRGLGMKLGLDTAN